MMYLLLIVGFVFLIKGADLFVEGAGSLAHSLKIPTLTPLSLSSFHFQ